MPGQKQQIIGGMHKMTDKVLFYAVVEPPFKELVTRFWDDPEPVVSDNTDELKSFIATKVEERRIQHNNARINWENYEKQFNIEMPDAFAKEFEPPVFKVVAVVEYE